MTSSQVCSPRQFKSVWRLGELTLAQLARTVFEQITVEQRGVAETEASASQVQSYGYSGPITLSGYERFQWIRDQLAKEGVTVQLPTGN